MGKSIDLTKVMDDTKKWFNDMTIKVKNMFNKPKNQPGQPNQMAKPSKPYDFKDMMNDAKAWFEDLPNKINRLVEKVKNYPPDKQAAVGSIVSGSLLVMISLILFII